MCGIAGVWTVGQLEERDLVRMTRTLAHRGPDDVGTWMDQEAGIGFGSQRLAIIDVSPAGHQPMVSKSGRYVLTYNGEIYNHAEIRREIESVAPQPWVGRSDTETFLAAVELWGLKSTIQKCVGMFALALWDRQQRTLSLVRDRMGEKPLYYGWSKGSFLFGSELKALTAWPPFDGQVDRSALDWLVRRSYVPSPLSIYADVYKLEPGTILELGEQAAGSPPAGFSGWPAAHPGLRLEKYWCYLTVAAAARADPITDPRDAIEGLEALLIDAVKRQSIADVPVGTFLSGGYDSSTIAALQQHHSGSQVKTFTIGFDELGFDEAPFAREVARHLGTDHHETRVTARDALDLIPRLASMYDEPFADSSQIPTHLLSQAARRKVTVALSGDGGDEMFGGYNRYAYFGRHRRRVRSLPRPARQAAAGLIRAVGTDRIDRLSRATGLAVRFPQTGLKAQKLAAILSGGDDLSRLYALLLSQWDLSSRVVLGAGRRPQWPKEQPLDGLDDAAQMMTWDSIGYLPDDILCKVDRASMAASLETHAPYLDHRVVEFAARIPTDMKLGADGSKWVLRQILYKHVPRGLVDRPKAGFSIPLGQWLRGPLRDWAEALLDRSRLAGEGHFDTILVRDRWAAHLTGRRDYSTALWPVLMFQLWLDSGRQSARSDGELATAAE